MGKTTDKLLDEVQKWTVEINKVAVKYNVYNDKAIKIEDGLKKAYKPMGIKFSQAIDGYRKDGQKWVAGIQDPQKQKLAAIFAKLIDEHDKLTPTILSLVKTLEIMQSRLESAAKNFKNHVAKKEKSKNPFKNKKSIAKAKAMITAIDDTCDQLDRFVYAATDQAGSKYMEESKLANRVKLDRKLVDAALGKSVADLKKELADEDD